MTQSSESLSYIIDLGAHTTKIGLTADNNDYIQVQEESCGGEDL